MSLLTVMGCSLPPCDTPHTQPLLDLDTIALCFAQKNHRKPRIEHPLSGADLYPREVTVSTTLTAGKPALSTLWQARRAEQDRLQLHLVAQRAICACSNCGDAPRGEELDYLIARSVAIISELSNRITDRSSP